MTFTFVDLFSGAGGMSYGFKSHSAFTPLLAVDAQMGKPSSGKGALECNKTYEANIGLKVREADLAHCSPSELMAESSLKPEDTSVLISCAPCTGFTRTLNKNHAEDDPRNSLVSRTADFVEALRPTILIMENARELVRGNFSHHLDRLYDRLNKLEYSFSAEIHMLTDFGLPQIRERAIVIAVKNQGKIKTLKDLWEGYTVSSKALTVRQAISSLPAVSAGETYRDDLAHTSPQITQLIMERLRAIPKDGGSWFDLVNHPDAERLLIPSMKKSIKLRKFGHHPDVYGRLRWDRPSVTIKRECSHVGNGRYSHPEQDRLCTVRELAILNGFPSDYKFVARALSNKYRHIGDAVPPLISYQLAHLSYWIITGKKPEIRDCILPGTSLSKEHIQMKHDNPLLFDLSLEHEQGINPA